MPTMRGGRPAVMVMPMRGKKLPKGMPHAAEGGLFGAAANTAYSPEDIGNLPVVRQARGEEATPRFGAFGGNTALPGSGKQIPYGAEFRYDTYEDMLPSSRALLENLVSSPREQGGLALDFTDFLEQSRRGAPLGRRFAPASYGA